MRYWTSFELELLSKLIAVRPRLSWPEIAAQLPGRTDACVRRQADQLRYGNRGTKARYEHPWTEADLNDLKLMVARKATGAEMRARFPYRTKGSINGMVFRIKRPYAASTAGDVAPAPPRPGPSAPRKFAWQLAEEQATAAAGRG